MNSMHQLTSKVLILDNSFELIREFCEQHGLTGLKVHIKKLLPILHSNIDLGAVFLAEDYSQSLDELFDLMRIINLARPELPILLRTTSAADFNNLPGELQKLFCATYTAEDLSPLKRVIDEFIFCLVYPNAFVRGMTEISVDTLRHQFKGFRVDTEAPYIVRDRIIYGEIVSLIEINSCWCRGYLMLQTAEADLIHALETEELCKSEASVTFRTVNNFMGETTNLIWGGFKSRFINAEDLAINPIPQVPIIINNFHKYISFGSENPHLCFKFTLVHENTGEQFIIYQWLVFNLIWAPENFKENQAALDQLVVSGELELF